MVCYFCDKKKNKNKLLSKKNEFKKDMFAPKEDLQSGRSFSEDILIDHIQKMLDTKPDLLNDIHKSKTIHEKLFACFFALEKDLKNNEWANYFLKRFDEEF